MAATDLRNRHNVPYKKVSHDIILELGGYSNGKADVQ